ncbi:hypothetical protein, partial [Vibrio sp. 10N.286.49.B3]|uniref:hypothetical protein n=1 Tax=Vibrio sp. 10N.286.49.B3 TaxID=1880855 RepID=UPI001A7E1B44
SPVAGTKLSKKSPPSVGFFVFQLKLEELPELINTINYAGFKCFLVSMYLMLLHRRGVLSHAFIISVGRNDSKPDSGGKYLSKM